MAAAARRPPPIFLLSGHVDMGGLTDEPGVGWTEIKCASRRAYGCGEHDGQEAAEGLKLYVRLGNDQLLSSSLAIRMSDDALRRFDSELQLGAPSKDMLPSPMEARPMEAVGLVQMAEEQDLTVIFLHLRRSFSRELAYYLVYDHVGASLSMIKYRPDLYVNAGTMKPVPKRHGSDFELFVMASQSSWFDTLCVCTPETRANPASEGTGPWQIKTRRIEMQRPFDPHVAFSFQGKGFWADLSQGVVYCDLHTTSDPVVDFGYIRLPRGCKINLEQMRPYESKLTRAMSCVRDSIWFVCIHYSSESAADDLVKIWILKVPRGKWQKAWWKQVEEVPVSALWGLDSFKEARLPQLPLEYPILTPDGALCVTLPDHSCRFHQREHVPEVDTTCIFKVRGERGLLWHGYVHRYLFVDPVICPSNFLQRKHGSSETEADEHCPAAGLAALVAGE